MDRESGQTVLRPKRFKKFVYHLARSFGVGLLGAAAMGYAFAFGPIIKQEVQYLVKGQEQQEQIKESKIIELMQENKAYRTASVQNEARQMGVDSYFSVVIPKIEASSNVISNVDPSSKEEYMEALQDGVAHAKGTNFPGQGKKIFLFSHSTDSPLNVAEFNADFYLLRKLEKGDKIIVFFADRKFIYEVDERVVTSPQDISWLVSESDEELLVMQTCDPPGTTLNRLLVIARPVK